MVACTTTASAARTPDMDPQDAINLVRAGAADIFSLYVGKEGIGQARKIAAIAEGAGIACTVGSNLELGIGAENGGKALDRHLPGEEL